VTTSQASKQVVSAVRHTDVVIVGAGLGGMAAAIAFKRQGFDDIVIVDRAEQFGGVWRDNTYPGVECDVPTWLYSFEFEPKRDWSRFFAPGAEIQQYLVQIADDYDLRRHTHFGVTLQRAQWDDDTQRWNIDTTAGRFVSRFAVFATGSLQEPKIPDFPGLSSFKGRIFHSSRWPADYDPTGDRVAVVGTGASAIQFVPKLQEKARQVVLFQRTPAWVFPKPNWSHLRIEHFLIKRVPGVRRLYRWLSALLSEMLIFGLWHPNFARALSVVPRVFLRMQVRDRKLRKVLTPNFLVGCKRHLVSNDWYPTLQKPNVDVVPHAFAKARPNSVVAEDGSEYPVDTIVLGTGFQFSDAPLYSLVHDRHGVPMLERWAGSPRAYLGTTMAGCPNAFIIWGPNAGTGSGFLIAESQARYIEGALRVMADTGVHVIEVREEAELNWKAGVNEFSSRSVQNIGGCTTYYVDPNGNNSTVWPGTMRSMWKRLSHFDIDAYRVPANGNGLSRRSAELAPDLAISR
jgi:cyclohexanone monooxygenase